MRRVTGRAPLFGVAICGLAVLAFRGLWLAPARYDVDALLFLPGGLPTLAVCALAGWMLYGRRERLRRLARMASATGASPMRRRLRVCAALALTGLGASLFFWATRTGKLDLLLASLAALGLAWATAWRGARGARAIALPTFVLLFGIRLPKPLEDEIVWLLQRRTAELAAWMLEIAGRDFTQRGVILQDAEHTFHVIDSCSGLNGIGILVLIALVVRELFREAGARLWLVAALAPALAIVLNTVRVALVAASPDPEKLAGIEGDHTPQGLAVLMLGTVLLYAFGRLLAHGRPRTRVESPARIGEADPRAGSEESKIAAGPRGLSLAIGLVTGTLALASFLVPRFPPPVPISQRVTLDFPEARAGWTTSPAPHEPLFTGVFAVGFHRRYQIEGGPLQAPEIVDVLVGYDDASQPDSTRLLSSKALVPGPDWQLDEVRSERIWALDREVESALASRPPGSERALVHVWRPGDHGLGCESLLALLGIESSPGQRARPRALVQLIVYARHDGALALDRAKQRLDRFVLAFRDDLQAL